MDVCNSWLNMLIHLDTLTDTNFIDLILHFLYLFNHCTYNISNEICEVLNSHCRQILFAYSNVSASFRSKFYDHSRTCDQFVTETPSCLNERFLFFPLELKVDLTIQRKCRRWSHKYKKKGWRGNFQTVVQCAIRTAVHARSQVQWAKHKGKNIRKKEVQCWGDIVTDIWWQRYI